MLVEEPAVGEDPVTCVEVSLPAVEVVKAVPVLADVDALLIDPGLDAVRVILVSVEADTFGTGFATAPVLIVDAKVFDEVPERLPLAPKDVAGPVDD